MEYLFGLGPGHLPDSVDAIARKHGACLVNYTEPNGHKRHWFAGPNKGSPFDGWLRDAVMSDPAWADVETGGE